jgi:3-dehydroquinate dehydratase
MKDKELKSIGKWLNTQGYNLNLSDGFWREEWILGEHTFRDIAQLLQDYHTEHLITVAVIKQYNEADLVSFGAYLLSEERQSRISEVNKNNVTDADIANWKAEINN